MAEAFGARGVYSATGHAALSAAGVPLCSAARMPGRAAIARGHALMLHSQKFAPWQEQESGAADLRHG